MAGGWHEAVWGGSAFVSAWHSLRCAPARAQDGAGRRAARDACSHRSPHPSLGITVTATRLDEARSSHPAQPRRHDLRLHAAHASSNVPQGENAPLNQVLLRAPGVAQDSFGQIHVRGDHGNLQYRLDGVQLPEGLSLFNTVLATRYADKLSLITGALPAQYGLQTAGIVDITLKSGTTDPGAEASMTGGSRDYAQPAFSYGGRSGTIDYFAHRPVPAQRPRHREPDVVVHAAPRRHRPVARAGQGHRHHRRQHARSASSPAAPARASRSPTFPARRRTSPSTAQPTSNSAILDQRQWEQHLLRHRLAAEDYGTVDFQLSGFARYSQPVLPARSVRRPGVQRHRAVDPAARASPPACRATAAGRSPTSTRCAAASWCSASAPPASPTRKPCRGADDDRHADRSRRPAHRLHRRLRPRRLDLRRLPAGRMEADADRDGELRRCASTPSTAPRRRTSSARASTSCGSPTTMLTAHAGYARYFTPPPLIQVEQRRRSPPLLGTDGRARSDAERSGEGRARRLFRRRLHR